MANRSSPPSSIAILSILSLLLLHQHYLPLSSAENSFEGFDEEEPETLDSDDTETLAWSFPPPTTLTHSDNPPAPPANSSPPSDLPPKPSSASFETSFDYWDEDEFEGLPAQLPPESPKFTENATACPEIEPTVPNVNIVRTYKVEIVCVSFLVVFLINYFIGRENENIALAWAAKFATKDSIFEKNFSLLRDGEGEDSPLLMKEGQNVFKFYASGRRFCSGLLATLELQSRHDLIARLYDMVVPCRDEISFEVYMNDEAMDQVVFALAKKKVARAMQKEERDLQRFASMLSVPSNKKWVPEDLAVISESKVAGDLITEAVLDQVFGDKAYEKFGKGFISMQFSDQHPGPHKKMLMFKFVLPDDNHMADMIRLVALVPYYIDLIGRYKLSSQARTKTEGARYKIAQEVYRELQNARQEALQKKKAERKKMMDAAEAKLNVEALHKKEAKERARHLKKVMPKVKMTRAH